MTQMMTRPPSAERIESSIDLEIAGKIEMDGKRGMLVDTMAQAMQVAKMMSLSDVAVPPHLRNKPGACLAIAIQGYEWGISPFAIANKSYVVNDRIGYESAMYNAVVTRRAPIKGRIKCEYAGTGAARTCRVWARLADEDEIVEYTSPPTGQIKPKNSPLWQNDPDQQLFYFSVRAFTRRHFADVMMGVYTVDEMEDAVGTMAQSKPAPAESRTDSLLKRITSRPVSEGQSFVPDPEAMAAAAKEAHEEVVDRETGEVIEQLRQPSANASDPQGNEGGMSDAEKAEAAMQDAYGSDDAAQNRANLYLLAKTKCPKLKGRSEFDGVLFRFANASGMKKIDDLKFLNFVDLHNAIAGGRFDWNTGAIE